jgi:DNA repair protein RecO (recombination protein O)
MSTEKAVGLVVRTTDYSETSRVVTIWTRELGKVRALAKGGRRLRSNFESALDLLGVCSIVFVRKTSGGLDLLTEARVVERFPRLRQDLPAFYAAHYIAELLGDWTEDYDPHAVLFDETLNTLRELGAPDVPAGPRLLRFETVLLKELGYAPVLDVCANCRKPLTGGDATAPNLPGLHFHLAGGGLVCGDCRAGKKGGILVSAAAWQALRQLAEDRGWRDLPAPVAAELRQLMNQYVCHLLGRRPRTMLYLGSSRS